MELCVLRYFLAVAQAESISGAAERLHLTRPTLSRQLIDLEASLGTKLFNRGRRGQSVAGDVYIGAGETDSLRILAQACKQRNQVERLFRRILPVTINLMLSFSFCLFRSYCRCP